MYNTVEDFVREYEEDARESQKMFGELTDAALSTPVADGHRTLGRVAWHVVQSVPEMLSTAGVKLDTSVVEQPVPGSAAESPPRISASPLTLPKRCASSGTKASWGGRATCTACSGTAPRC
jgi:hypothetical protein